MATKVIKTPGQRLALETACARWEDLSGIQQAQYEARAAKLDIAPITEEVADKPTDGQLLVKAYDTSCNGGNDAVAAEFLRLRAERDGTGEPLPVTAGLLNGWMHECCSSYVGFEASKLADRVNQHRGAATKDTSEPLPVTVADYNKWISEHDRQADHTWITYVVDRINQHRGIRPVPQVTAEMWGMSHGAFIQGSIHGGANGYHAAADYLNAELAKAATVTPVTPVKVAGFVCIDGSLHTFEDVNELKAFRDDDNWEFGQTWEIIQQYEHHPRKDGGA